MTQEQKEYCEAMDVYNRTLELTVAAGIKGIANRESEIKEMNEILKNEKQLLELNKKRLQSSISILEEYKKGL